MRVGSFVLAARFPGQGDGEALHRAVRSAEVAEEAGLDSVWLAEHHFVPYGTCPSAITLAALLLGRTSRLRVGTAVTVLPTAHPVAVGEQAALLHIASGGRFSLGVGRGGPWVDLEVFGQGLKAYEEGFPESLDLLLRWLREPSVAAAGERFGFREVPVVPRPSECLTDVGGPEVVVACTSPHSGRGWAVTLTSASTDSGNDFGNYTTGSIAGSKWDDANDNGVWNENEDGLEGWRINLYEDTNGNGQVDESGKDLDSDYIPDDHAVAYFDVAPDGTYAGPVPGTGNLLVRAEVKNVGRSQTMPLGDTVNLAIPSPIKVDFEIVDHDTGAPIPGRLLVIGTHPAYPDSRVFMLTGDGAFCFNGMEFDTAVRHNLNIVAILGNDSAWGIDRQIQLGLYGRAVATDLRQTRYEQVVQGLGGYGEFVERPEDLKPALERALAAGKPALLNVAIERAISPRAEAAIGRRKAAAPK